MAGLGTKSKHRVWFQRFGTSCICSCVLYRTQPLHSLLEPTFFKYKVERDERYLPYIELGRWLCSHFQLETPLNFHKPITQKLIQPREINLTSLDCLGSCESIYVYFKPKKPIETTFITSRLHLRSFSNLHHDTEHTEVTE